MSIEDQARDLLRRALRDTTPDPERDAAGRAYFGAVYLPPGENPPDGVNPFDASFRQIASVAFRGGWHAAREADTPGFGSAAEAVLSVLADVAEERVRQDAKWGQQNHPDGTGPSEHLADSPKMPRYADLARYVRERVDMLADAARSRWSSILLEEVFEALAEDDPATLRRELVQVAAVAASWVEAIDRRTTTPTREDTPT